MLKKLLHWTLFGVVCLVTLVALFYAVENWRGKHAWEKYRAEREAKGDRFEWSAIVSPPVPDDQNFAATPLFAELFPKPSAHPRLDAVKLPDCKDATGNWHEGRHENLAAWQACFTNDNLLAALAQYNPILREVTDASRRPACRFPIRYEDHYLALLPHLTHLRKLAQVYRLRALAQLHAGQPDAALADVQMCLRLADTIKDEPILISFLVRAAILDLALQPVWEGLVTHQWKEQQLAALQGALGSHDVFTDFAKALQGERLFAHGGGVWMINHPAERAQAVQLVGDRIPTLANLLYRAIPTGWLYQNLLAIDRFYTAEMLLAVTWQQRQVNPDRIAGIERSLQTSRTTPYNRLCKMLVPAVTQVAKKAAQSQTALDQAITACGVELYRYADGQLPETLDAPVPTYLPAVPRDVIDGQPLRYRRLNEKQFILYSVGWNATDDGGLLARTKDAKPRLDLDHGDWVWPAASATPERD
jgi:hypothetical protein